MATALAPDQPYDLKINLEEGAKPFHRPIYSLLPPELTTLRDFLEENTKNGFICPSKSPWGSPVLFIKKKDGSLLSWYASSASSTCPQPSPTISNSVHLPSGVPPIHTV